MTNPMADLNRRCMRRCLSDAAWALECREYTVLRQELSDYWTIRRSSSGEPYEGADQQAKLLAGRIELEG